MPKVKLPIPLMPVPVYISRLAFGNCQVCKGTSRCIQQESMMRVEEVRLSVASRFTSIKRTPNKIDKRSKSKNSKKNEDPSR